MAMIFKTKVRVRYAEVDRSGFVYNGNYAQYYEMARTGAMRDLGYDYKDMEDKYGIVMPLREQYSRFLKPALYDDELEIVTTVPELPTANIKFNYQIFKGNMLIHEGYSQLVFLNMETYKPIRAPQWFVDALKAYDER